AKKVANKVEEIIYLGDILINYGDFFNRAHVLVPAGYCEEWWVQELESEIKNKTGELNYGRAAELTGIGRQRMRILTNEFYDSSIKADEALRLSSVMDVSLHPKFTYHWNSISAEDIGSLFEWLSKGKEFTNEDRVDKLVIAYDEKGKGLLDLLGVVHSVISKEYVVIIEDNAFLLSKFIAGWLRGDKKIQQGEDETNVDIVSRLFNLKIRDKNGTFIGARMGRPEKAKVRKLSGQPHCLFPVGSEGGRLRCFQSSLTAGKVVSDFPMYRCKCGNETVFGVCEKCGSRTKKVYFCNVCGEMETEKCERHGENKTFKNRAINIIEIFDNTIKNLKFGIYPDLIKGVRGTSNKDHMPEHLSKGILRAKHNIPVNKDGTTRYDMTQLAITNFKPKEIGTAIEKLKELGYDKDIHGNDLVNEDQILGLYPQDLILPSTTDSMEEGADSVLYRVALFIDELLEKLYGLRSYYELKSKTDLVGQLVIALAPHTSAGIIGRIVG
ncbi:MAG: DNA polymerase II large subunit, partial [Thermodesulfovibrionia bacterium]|nr:DNA polymerase II large subunit [Thermodesulfovibrionia bacterium]